MPGGLGFLPITVLYAVVFIAPLAAFLRASLLRNAGPASFGEPTLQNFIAIVNDPYDVSLLLTTSALAAVSATLSVALGYPIAYRIGRSSGPWSKVLFRLCIASMFTSAIVAALGFKVLLRDSGAINQLAMDLGLTKEPLPLRDNFFAVALGIVHVQLPLAVLALVPACESLPRSILEAAQGLGATRWQSFWQVSFPMTRSAVVRTTLLLFAVGHGAFATPLLLGGGRVPVISLEIRQKILELLDWPGGAALSVVVMLVVFLVVLITLLVWRDQPIAVPI